ncbi:hypothetical protein C0Q70_19543 [Pomacea canaliculata]|uniref:RING-type E3 ubiquitin transferase n=1 Tax=Pomacea canaliculata TaxID=400727 RepID=A0A2T7NJL9_POMCA|nr:hypothetical protein C0Q70_19543 [Pomacea canaliculata]
MGLKLSSQNPPRLRTYSGSSPGPSGSNELALSRNGGPGSSGGARTRARSLGNFPTPGHSSTLSIPGASGGVHRSNSPDSDSSTPEDGVFGRAFAHSLPVHLFALQGIKCPVCSKAIAADDVECHLVMCLTKPRISYNGALTSGLRKTAPAQNIQEIDVTGITSSASGVVQSNKICNLQPGSDEPATEN